MNYPVDKVKKMLMDEEGFRSRLYRCPKGFLTIGFGFNLDTGELPLDIAIKWLEFLLDKLEADLSRNIHFWDQLCFSRQCVLIDMAYNLGVGGLLGFKDMLKALEVGDYFGASNEMLASQWAKDVKGRADNLARIMAKGEF